MRLSQYYLPLLRDTPSEAAMISHQLMLRTGMIRSVAHGIYSMLPLGLRVMKNINKIVRKHLDGIGALEMIMPIMQPADLWQESQRSDAYGLEILSAKDRSGRDLLYSPTNEELITDIFRKDNNSYKSLPLSFYQIQWKFRDEIRPRFGVMRSREFLMMDGYSFHLTEEDAINHYHVYYKCFLNIIRDMDMIALPVQASTGAIGGNLSHEFQILTKTGESAVVYDQAFQELLDSPVIDCDAMLKLYAKTKEEHEENVGKENPHLYHGRGIEVGHIFYFGNKYSQAMRATVSDRNNDKIAPFMGSYGLGISRIMAAAIECNNDKKGIIWPENIAPFKFILLNLDVRGNNPQVAALCEKIYAQRSAYDNVLFDDSSDSVGSKLNRADLLGIPYQIIVSERHLEHQTCELQLRSTAEKHIVSVDKVIDMIHRNSN